MVMVSDFTEERNSRFRCVCPSLICTRQPILMTSLSALQPPYLSKSMEPNRSSRRFSACHQRNPPSCICIATSVFCASEPSNSSRCRFMWRFVRVFRHKLPHPIAAKLPIATLKGGPAKKPGRPSSSKTSSKPGPPTGARKPAMWPIKPKMHWRATTETHFQGLIRPNVALSFP